MSMLLSSLLLNRVDPDTTIVTVNRRLARTLSQQIDQQQIALGAEVWPTPQILPLSTWLEQCWDQLLDQVEQEKSWHESPPLSLLTPWQERLLWERVIQDSDEAERLLRVPEAAQNAQNAWKLLQDWRVSLTEADLYSHEDAQAFNRWSIQLIHYCQKENWLDRARLSGYLVQHLPQISLPKRLFLAGFQRKTPAYHALLSALADAGVAIEELPLTTGSTGSCMRIGFTSIEAEILAAAQWSRQELTASADKKIGIVAPALESIRPKVVEIFSRVFYPGNNPVTLDPRSSAFNISLGVRLADTPLIKDGLLLLELGKESLSLEKYSAILLSPFWSGGQSEWCKRSLLDARLRNKGIVQMSPGHLCREAKQGEKSSPPCPLLAERLSAFVSHNKNLSQKEKPSTWADRFSQWLVLLGWPGERSLTSGEHQTTAAWQEALATFSSWDKIIGRISMGLALSYLKRLAAEIPFQPESGDAPVQVLGLLEAVGESYDGLWVLGLSEDLWPPPLEPNAFIPIAFQRRHGMPQSSFDLEVAYDTLVFDELIASSEQIILSYPTQNGDQPLRPSPLIVTIPEGTISDKFFIKDYNQIIFATSDIIGSVDEYGPPFQTENPVSTGVLKSQAQCPFQAFSRFRLGADVQQEPMSGLDPSQRGQLVHGALTQLWQTIQENQADLVTVQTSPQPWVQTAIQKTLDHKSQHWLNLTSPFFRKLEEARLERLLHSFLNMENRRDEPFAVQEQEVDGLLVLGRLTLRVRMDRIDRLQDGSLVVLDYKTGQVKMADWFGDRPEDPQLPLYVLVQKQPVSSMAFYKVQATGCSFVGLANREGILPKIIDFQKSNYSALFADWSSLQNHWRAVLTALGETFIQGDARIDPLPKACTYCNLQPLCRLW